MRAALPGVRLHVNFVKLSLAPLTTTCSAPIVRRTRAVACGLLHPLRVFWRIAANAGPEDGERLVREVAALVETASDLEGPLAASGTEGLAGIVGLQRRLRGVLDAMSTADLEDMAARVATLSAALVDMERRLTALRALKLVLERVDA